MANTAIKAAPTAIRAQRRAGGRRVRRGPLSRIGDVIVAIAVVLISAPFAYAVVTSLRPASDVINDPFGWPTSLTVDNITKAFSKMNYTQGLLSSTIVLVGTLIFTI